MKTPELLAARFREEGRRVTPQRECVFRHLWGDTSHPTVEALHERVLSEMSTVSLKTVYQTVHDLADMGEVSLIDLGTGTQRVEPNVEESHHHLVCIRCGMIRDVPATEPQVAARHRRGFSVGSVEVNYRGVCERCA
ncbi:MAG: Fur family transcriptional regulator [Acidimicrobiia bacterium]